MSNLSVAEEFRSMKIKYSVQLLNTMWKKKQKTQQFRDEAADFHFV